MIKICPQCTKQFTEEFTQSHCPEDGALLMPFVRSLIGTVIQDRYQVQVQLASGGWSEIYVATDQRLNRRVALKLLRLNLAADPERVRRFQNEAESASQLRHSNIVSVHDYGITDQGRPFLVMDFVDGMNLADALRLRNFHYRQAATIIMELASAISVAHEQGIVHRDIKPANIMISNARGEKVRSQLVDFGIAKTIRPDDLEGMTRTGELLGTPAYMSPEQCRGLPLDGRADIYSLGCVFYELLTGIPIVSASNTFDFMNWHLHGEMPSIRGNVPQSIVTIVKRMVEKNPDARYQDALTIAKDLNRALSGHKIESTSDHKLTAARFTRNKANFATSAVVLGSIVLFVFALSNEQIFKQTNAIISPPASDVLKQMLVRKVTDDPVQLDTLPADKDFVEESEGGYKGPCYSVRELTRQVNFVQAAAKELKKEGRASESSNLENSARKCQALLSERAALPDNGDVPELIVASIYSGDESRTLSKKGLVEVSIAYNKCPLILVINSYRPVIWRLKIGQGVRLKKIILCGHRHDRDESVIENPPLGVEVERKNDVLLPFEYSGQTEEAVRDIPSKGFNMKVTALLSSPNEKYTIGIGPRNINFRAQIALNQLSASYKQAMAYRGKQLEPILKSMRFQGVCALGQNEFDKTGVFTLNGLGPLTKTRINTEHDNLVRVAYSPKEDLFYGLTCGDLRRFPRSPQQTQELFVTANTIKVGGTCGIAYDTKRQNALVSSDNDDGKKLLYGYDAAKKKWSPRGQTYSKYFCMFYEQSTDKILGIPEEWEHINEVNKIVEMNAMGQRTNAIKLDKSIWLSNAFDAGLQIFAKDNLLLVISPKVNCDQEDSRSKKLPQNIYVFDRKTGTLIHQAPISWQND